MIYKGYTIERHLSGWFSAFTDCGTFKADTLTGIKKLINNAMKAEKLKELAQRLFDKDNWHGLNSSERKLFIAAQLNYLELTGKKIDLGYNCPA